MQEHAPIWCTTLGKRPVEMFARENAGAGTKCISYASAITECTAASLALDEEERNLEVKRVQVAKKRKIAAAVFSGVMAETEFDYYTISTSSGYSVSVLAEETVNLVKTIFRILNEHSLIVEKKHAAFIDLDDATKEHLFDGSMTVGKVVYMIGSQTQFRLARLKLTKTVNTASFHEFVFAKQDSAFQMQRRIFDAFENDAKGGKFSTQCDFPSMDQYPESIVDVVMEGYDVDDEIQKIKKALKQL